MSDFNMKERLEHLDNILNGRFDLEPKEEEEKEEEQKEEEQFSSIITEEMITAPSTSSSFVPIEEEEEEDIRISSMSVDQYPEQEIDRTPINYDNKQSVSSISNNSVPDSMTLDQFINNREVNQVAYDFFQDLSEEGDASDMMYYFRKEISIDDMIRRVTQSKNWSEEQKGRYLWLKEQFNKTNWSDSSFQQKFKSARQYGWQAISDPSMVVAMLVAPFTGGGSVAARTGAAEAGKLMLRSALVNTMKSGVTKNNVGTIARSLVSTPTKSSAVYSGLYSGVIERLDQEVEMQLDPEKKGVNYTDWATATGMGIIFGGAVGKGVEKLPVVTTPIKNAIAKTYTFTDELTGNSLTNATELLIQRPMDTAMARSFGKAVSEFKTIVKYSPTAKKILESINALGLRRTFQQADEQMPKGYIDDAWGWQGEFSVKLDNILEPLRSGVRKRISTRAEGTSVWSQLKGPFTDKSWYRLDDETDLLLSQYMRGAKIADEEIMKAAKYNLGPDKRLYTVEEFKRAGRQLRELDDEAFELATEQGLKLGYVDDHFPRVYNKYLKTKEGKEYFTQELINSGQFKTRALAEEAIEEMLNKADRYGLGSSVNGRFRRTLDKIKDYNVPEILDNNVEAVYRQYFWDVAKLSAEVKHGGVPTLNRVLLNKNGDKLTSTILGEDTKGLGSIIWEATKSGGSIEQELKAAGKENLLRGRQKLERLQKMWKFTIGDLPQLTGGKRLASEAVQVVTQVATLPLATLTSLSEAFVPLTRVDAPNYIKNALKVIAVRGQTTASNAMKAVDIKPPSWLTKSESMEAANSVFVALDQATMQRIDSMFAGDVKNPLLKSVQRGFFKLNLLAEWTRTVELASFMMGKDLIKKNANKLNKGGYSKSSMDRYTLELNELGVNVPTAKRWANGELSKQEALLFERQINEGGAKFSRQVILNPKTAGLTSLWLQDPRYNVLTQLLAYPYAFGNTIMKRYAQGMLQGPVQTGQALVGGTMMAMTGIVGNEFRSRGEKGWGKQSDEEVIFEGIKRVGGLGMLEYLWRGKQQLEYTEWGGILKMLKVTPAMGSPTGSDAIDFVSGTRSLWEIIITKSPGFQAYPKDVQKRMLQWAKENSANSRNELYNFLKSKGVEDPEKLGYPKRKTKFEGGEISKDFPVPNVKKEPSEMINKATGLPYESEMERLGMEDGGLLVSIGVAPVSEKQIGKLKKGLKKRKAKRDGGEIRQQYAFGDRIKKVFKQKEPLLPSNMRQFIYDLAGGDETFTEKDLQQDELKAMKELVASNLKDNKYQISYDDYGTAPDPKGLSDVGGKNIKNVSNTGFISRLKDPRYSMKTTIGAANITVDENENVFVIDQYNFNNSPFSPDAPQEDSSFIRDALKRRGNIYGQLRNVGKHFGSPEGEGSPIVLNLGKIQDLP